MSKLSIRSVAKSSRVQIAPAAPRAKSPSIKPAKQSRRAGTGVAVPGLGDTHAMVHLNTWIKANAKDFLPPVSNKQLFSHSADCVLFVSGGPNTRNDYHVNPTEELFFQLKGDVAVRIRPLDGTPPHDVIIREGEMLLLPRWVPHRPQRPKGTLGLIVVFPRPEGELDGLRWYCPSFELSSLFSSFFIIPEVLTITVPQVTKTCEAAMRGETAQRAVSTSTLTLATTTTVLWALRTT